MDRRRWRPAVAAGVALVLLTTGCQAPTPSVTAGAWADEFKLAAEEAATEEEREALADGVITDQEYAYFQARILECLEAIGVDASWTADGTLSYNPNGADNQSIDDCNIDNGDRLLALRDAIIRNPDHLDQSKILVECLRRVGVVGRDYTVDDLNAELDFDRILTSPDFAGCIADPLHHE